MDKAAKAKDLALRIELAEERGTLEQKMARAEEDRERLARTLEQACKDLAAEQNKLYALQQQIDTQSADLKHLRERAEEERKQLAAQMKDAEDSPKTTPAMRKAIGIDLDTTYS